VLAGGGSTRFGGRPKGLEPVGGTRILDRVVDTLAVATGGSPVIASSLPEARAWRRDLTVVPDALAGGGALVGIYSAVMAVERPVVILGWDMPFVPPGLIRELMAGAAGYDVFLPESGGPRGVEPLCAVYTPACAPAIRDCLARGDRRAVGFHDAVRVGILPLAAVSRYGDPERLFFNVNTPADLERAEALWRQSG
jgi:molybdopterin-guanine dinucleotide biosynthesis protein A